MTFTYPNFFRRYLALLTDGLLIWVLFYFILQITENLLGFKVSEQYLYFILSAIIYDAFLTAKFCTFGQLIFNFRIRSSKTFERVGLLTSFVRTLVKLVLGSISVIVIIFNRKRLALHDMISTTIALDNVKLQKDAT
jgi:uncharacterized RDD family membrane protein YckC